VTSFLGIGGTVTLLPLSGQLSANNTDADGATQVVPGNVTITSLRGRIVNRTIQALVGTTIVVTATLFHGSGGGPLLPALSCDAIPFFTGIVAPGTVAEFVCTGASIPFVAGDTGYIQLSAATDALVPPTLISLWTAVSLGGQ
jgi:hypothetical protein